MPAPREFDITDKVFVAVGAGRGIGRGIVEVLTESGADGALVAITPTYVVPLAERFQAQSGRKVTGIVADATSGADMDRVVEQVLKDFGRIDIWVNTVGDAISKPFMPGPAQEGSAPTVGLVTDEEWRTVIDINLTSIMVGTRAIGRYFLDRGAGRVINIGSFAGLRGGINLTTYSAAKAGVSALTRSVALEWAPYGVTVNCIAPGTFPDAELAPPDQLARSRERGKSFPLKRVGEVREVGLLTLYLASDASAYMTGQTLYLDGGMTL